MNSLAQTWECSVHPGEKLPILVKLIDARDNLSVQVHPNDDYALKNEGELGKTEMWYVNETSDEASLIYKFIKNVTRDEIEKASQDGTIEKYLQKVSIKKDDVFLFLLELFMQYVREHR